MPSSYSASCRFELQFTGENLNTWGIRLNSALSRVDDAIAGWFTKALTTDYSLSTANGSTDEARMAMLKFTGTGAFTVTIPALSKSYDVWNACTGILTVSNGSASVTLQAGEKVSIATDGGANIFRVQPTDFGGSTLTNVGQISGLSSPTLNTHAATKKYVDDTAFASGSGALPGQGGNAGKFLTTDGSAASWGSVIPTTRAISGGGLATGGGDFSADRTITVTGSTAAQVRTGTSTSTAVTPSALMGSSAHFALTDASTIAWDVQSGYNAQVTLTGNAHTVGAPTNLVDGQFISLDINSGAGSFTLSWNALWDFGLIGVPIMPVTASKVLTVTGKYSSTTGKIRASASQPA